MSRLLQRSFWLAACWAVLASGGLFAQQPIPQAPPAVTRAPAGGRTDSLSRFDLDFPGGTPKQLVLAIQKAMGRQLNVIVPDEFADTRLPALKMERVNVAQLFEALTAASQKSEAVQGGNQYGGMIPGNYQVVQTGYGFRQGPGEISDDTIWYFYVNKPALPPLARPVAKICRFYSLVPYLDQDLKVDDITTAIDTGWKMLGESPVPTISFHKDTKLLIAVGEPEKLQIIDSVLEALRTQRGGYGDAGPARSVRTSPAQPAPEPTPPQPSKPDRR